MTIGGTTPAIDFRAYFLENEGARATKTVALE